jgi:hypothetical protein
MDHKLVPPSVLVMDHQWVTLSVMVMVLSKMKQSVPLMDQ